MNEILSFKEMLNTLGAKDIFKRVIGDRLAYYKYMRRCPNCDKFTYDNVSGCYFCHELSPVSEDLSWDRRPKVMPMGKSIEESLNDQN